MPDRLHKPRVALLGVRDEDLEILAQLQRQDQVSLVAVYDPDPHAPGLALAEIAGVPAGADAVARQRLAEAEIIVLPSNRLAYRDAIDWCSGLRAQLLGVQAARQRWGGPMPAATMAGAQGDRRELAAELEELEGVSRRVRSRLELGEWLLDAAMRAVGATGGSLQLLAADTSELYLLAARGLAEDVLRHSRQPLGTPIAGLAAAMRTAQVLHGPQPARMPSQRGDVSSALCVPLATRDGELIGVLNVSSTVPGRRFGPPDLETLQRAAPAVATLLRQSLRCAADADAAAAQIFACLAAPELKNSDITGTMTAIARELHTCFDAETVSMHVPSEGGDWLQLAAATRPGVTAAPTLSRALAGRAFTPPQWVHVTEAAATPAATGDDSVAAAVDRALAPADAGDDMRSWVVAPLVGTAPVGVLCAVFTRLATAEAFVAHGPPAVRHLSLYLETRIHERRLAARAARSAQLARLLPTLLDASSQGALETVLVREAALLVGAERVLLRHVDEARRTYSRPITHGIPATNAATWRTVDASVTERTLQRRQLDLRTLESGEEKRLAAAPRAYSLMSLPIQHGDRIIAVLNVYGRQPLDPLEGPAFTPYDAELLQSLGAVAAMLWPRAAADAATAHPSPGAAISGNNAGADIDSKRLREELQREIVRAERHQRPLTLSLLHVKGLVALETHERTQLLGHLDRLLREFVRRSDLLGWYGPDRLLIVSPEADARGSDLETRIRQLLHGKLPATPRIEVQLGSSSYPRDGGDAAALLQVAVARLA